MVLKLLAGFLLGMLVLSMGALAVGVGVPSGIDPSYLSSSSTTDFHFMVTGDSAPEDIVFFIGTANGMSFNGVSSYEVTLHLQAYEHRDVFVTVAGLNKGKYLVTWGYHYANTVAGGMDQVIKKTFTAYVDCNSDTSCSSAATTTTNTGSSSSSSSHSSSGGSGGSAGFFMSAYAKNTTNSTNASAPVVNAPKSTLPNNPVLQSAPQSAPAPVVQNVGSDSAVSEAYVPQEISTESTVAGVGKINLKLPFAVTKQGVLIFGMIVAGLSLVMQISAVIVAKKLRGAAV